MRRLPVVSVIAVMLPLMSAIRGEAAPESPFGSYHGAVTATVGTTDVVSLTCDGRARETVATAVVALDRRSSTDSHTTVGVSTFQEDVSIEGGAGDVSVARVRERQPAVAGLETRTYTSGTWPRGRHVVRATWAAWGGSISCTLRVNGRLVTARRLRGGFAMAFGPSHFRSGYADAGIAGIGVSGSFAGELERTTRGFLVAVLDGGGRSSLVHVVAPGATAAEYSAGQPIVVAGWSNGTWTYGIDGHASTRPGERLWILEVPG